jgi:glycosyltransferase involved in cell wall biosynthesis
LSERHINPISEWADIRKLRVYLEEHHFDIVHCHLIHDHWVAAMAIRGMAPDKRPRLIRTVHRFEKMRRDPFHHILFERMTDLVITVSEAQKKIIETALPKLSERLRVIHGGVDPERYRPDLDGASAVRADMGEKPATQVAAIVAHLGYKRGHHWLLKAAPAAMAKLPHATIWIVGSGEIGEDLRKELRDERYRKQVVMAGYRKDDLPELYATINVGLLLALGSEGSARAALECMAAGHPVIAVAKGALLDTITHGHDGLLVPENDVEALTRALIDLLGDPEKSRQMGLNARQTILARFTEEHRAEKTLQAYREILAAPRAKS